MVFIGWICSLVSGLPGNEHTLTDTDLALHAMHSRMGLGAKVDGMHGSMGCNGAMLGEVVGSVAFSCVPIVLELALGVAILEPKITHVHGFGAALLLLQIWVGGCGWPISGRATRIGTASWLL